VGFTLYLVWHLRRAWAPLCFTDEEPPARTDPVAPAVRSAQALAKASRKRRGDGGPVHSYATLLDELASLTRNTLVFAGGARLTKLAALTPLQRRAFELSSARLSPSSSGQCRQNTDPHPHKAPCPAGGFHVTGVVTSG
jgi:hypothetical protein